MLPMSRPAPAPTAEPGADFGPPVFAFTSEPTPRTRAEIELWDPDADEDTEEVELTWPGFNLDDGW